MRTIWPHLLLLLLLLPWTACRTKPPTYPLTLDRQEAARTVVSRLAGVHALRAEVGLRFTRGDESHSASGALVVEKPDRIRMRCWGPLGVTVLDLLARDDLLTLYLPREERALEMPRGEETDVSDLDPAFRSLLLVESVLAELSTADLPYRIEDDPGPELGALTLLRNDRPLSRLVYDRRTLLLVTRESLRDPRHRTTYEDYRPLGERWWPRKLTVEMDDLRLEVRLRDVEVDPELDPVLFEMDLPPGTAIESP